MAVAKQLVLIEATSDDHSPGLEDAVARAIAGHHAEPGLVGLVVDTVVEPLTGTPRALAVVQAWWDGADRVAGARDVASWVSELDVATSTWLVDEIVFRQPRVREAPPAAHERVNMIGTAFRRDDFTVEEFFDYWITTHAPISGRVPGSVGYVVSRVHGAGGARSGDGVDGFIELWYPDRCVFDAAGSTPEQDAAWADVANYAKTTGEFWLTSEQVVIPPPTTGPGLLETGL